ncbi:MAG: hypothetical protein JW928_00905 [Candidatus Aureabacteria bacterium]|nr:hypothetical protein [Candidatus Auribacterota bacterium]
MKKSNTFQNTIKYLKSNAGQGVTEVLIVVALIAIAGILGYILFGNNIRKQFAKSGRGVGGYSTKDVGKTEVWIEVAAHKDLSNFADGLMMDETAQSSDDGSPVSYSPSLSFSPSHGHRDVQIETFQLASQNFSLERRYTDRYRKVYNTNLESVRYNHNILDSKFIREGNSINGFLLVETNRDEKRLGQKKTSKKIHLKKVYYSGYIDENGQYTLSLKKLDVVKKYTKDRNIPDNVGMQSEPLRNLSGNINNSNLYLKQSDGVWFGDTMGYTNHYSYTMKTANGQSIVETVEKENDLNKNYSGNYKGYANYHVSSLSPSRISESDIKIDGNTISGYMILESNAYKVKQYFEGTIEEGETNAFTDWKKKVNITGTRVEYLSTSTDFEYMMKKAGLKERPSNWFSGSPEFFLQSTKYVDGVGSYKEKISLTGRLHSVFSLNLDERFGDAFLTITKI